MNSKDRIIKLIDADMNDMQIEREIGCVTREYVRQVRSKHRPGVKSSHYHEPCSIISEEKLAEIIKIINTENVTWQELGEKFSVSPFVLSNLCKKYGIKKPHGIGKRKDSKPLLVPKDVFIRALEVSDGNIRAASKSLGISYLTGINYGKRYGIKGIGKGGRKVSKSKMLDFEKRYSKGQSINKIAKETYSNWYTVEKYLKRKEFID